MAVQRNEPQKETVDKCSCRRYHSNKEIDSGGATQKE